MEQQEEKKRKDYKGRRRQSKSTLSLPLDITSEILLRLPEKSVGRFLCESKLWSSITTDPYFINLFETQLPPHPSLLLCFIKDGNLFVSSIPQHTLHQNSNKSYSSSSQYLIVILWNSQKNGLICFPGSGKPIVWNPRKRQVSTFPKPRLTWKTREIFLGYDPIESKYKLMCVPSRRSSDVCQVLTLGSAQKSWRTVKTNHKHRSSFRNSGRCIDGVIYYITHIYRTIAWVIMSFDVRFENFGKIDLPSDIHRDMLINYGGRFACVDKTWWKNTLWILKDAEKHKWSSKDFFSPINI
ncbi:LOW QUALITY PROTEIN: putative F-box protein At1g47765 [Eutrema salsugineum]|uniref:LOW QUALITY PROTEIN: putative F-box protein At1g47765 n=1 Tax=Eutrema salsugineum TaxID=72664 RepID=UPI000CED3E31|nr:LOW QUALITY PROTEIN: putative F-box protein At1g47765 [Eutrema salsugineum]